MGGGFSGDGGYRSPPPPPFDPPSPSEPPSSSSSSGGSGASGGDGGGDDRGRPTWEEKGKGRERSPSPTFWKEGEGKKTSESVSKGLNLNPFEGKSFEEIDKMLTERGFRKIGPDPASGKGSYFHPETGRKYYLDEGGRPYKEGMEAEHVDVHHMKDDQILETSKRRYPLNGRLILENSYKRR